MDNQVELIYIPINEEVIHFKYAYTQNMTVADLLQKSGLEKTNPEVKDLKIGIFSKIVSLDTIIKPGDRLEIYRPLLIDPKEKRRQRAKK